MLPRAAVFSKHTRFQNNIFFISVFRICKYFLRIRIHGTLILDPQIRNLGSELLCLHVKSCYVSQGGDEGVFWISYTDVLKFFDCIDICKVRRALTSSHSSLFYFTYIFVLNDKTWREYVMRGIFSLKVFKFKSGLTVHAPMVFTSFGAWLWQK